MRFVLDDSGKTILRVNQDINEDKIITISEGIECIQPEAFAYTHIDEIVFPKSLKFISRSAFACSWIKKVVIPGNVKEIDMYAFAKSKVESVVFEENDDLVIKNNCFFSCLSLTHVDMGMLKQNVIPEGLFKGCNNLESVIFPKGVKEIRDEAFYECGLKELELPETVVFINRDAFFGNTLLENVCIGRNMMTIVDNAFKACNIKHLTIYEPYKEQPSCGLHNVFNCNPIEKLDVIYANNEGFKYAAAKDLLMDIKEYLEPGYIEKTVKGELRRYQKANYGLVKEIIRNVASKQALIEYLESISEGAGDYDMVLPYVAERLKELERNVDEFEDI